ncbi:MAG: exosortase/archaeosortase family protein [archaeon]
MALLPAIILSTFDRSLRKRIMGVISGILLIVLINPLRIFVVMWTGTRFGWGVAEFMHSFTFRLTLILIILGFYYIWYLKYEEASNALRLAPRFISRKIDEIRGKIR